MPNIKPLVWTDYTTPEGEPATRAETILGNYTVWANGSWLVGSMHHKVSGGSLETGKREAEQDYTSRVQSALVAA